ncbi:MAG: hypothetical protein J6A16_05105 [Oscillospiraceae bacterium]|nr:hypothetical protein [Oscillospiraceae bacterium]
MVIRNNKTGQFAVNRQQGTQTKLQQAAERLTSGLRINSAADDAAGLAISEKLRSIDRGLRQGARNINDGINYTVTVDGAAQELHDMLHRMRELAVQAGNETYTEIDRAAMDLEYQQLIDEIDRITGEADFNGLPLFEKHLEAYEMQEGNVVHNRPVKIDRYNDTLNLGYTPIGGESIEISINIPHGTYSAEEVADLIDTELYSKARSLIIGINESRNFTLQCEEGNIDYIGGSGASLFYEMVQGSAEGYLLGVTYFVTDTAKLKITEGHNDVMSFRIGNDDDTIYSVQLEEGAYTREQLIDHINEKIGEAGLPTEVKAVPEYDDQGRKIIGLASKEVITGLSGNFIKIDEHHSPIYDISFNGNIANEPSVFTGKKRIPSDLEILRGRNEYFVLDVGYYAEDGSAVDKKIRIDLLQDGENVKTYSPSELASTIQKQLEDAEIPVTVELDASSGAIVMTSDQFGRECTIELDKTDVPSVHMAYDIFDVGDLRPVSFTANSTYRPASLVARKTLDSEIRIPSFENQLNFFVTVEGESSARNVTIDIPAGIYSKSEIQTLLNDALKNDYPDIAEGLKFTVGTNLTLAATGTEGQKIVSIKADNTCSAYSRLIGGVYYVDNYQTKNGGEANLVEYHVENPYTGEPAVSYESGSSTDGVKYDIDRTPQKQDKYDHLKYTPTAPKIIQGSETIDNTEGAVSDVVDKKPAVMTLKGVLSQFNAVGTSIRDIDLSFDITDSTGTKNFSITIPEGYTASQALSKINEKLGLNASAAAVGNDLMIMTTDMGAGVEIGNVTGNMLNTATKHPAAYTSGSVISDDKKYIYIPAELSVNNAQSNIPLTVDDSSDVFSFSAGGKTYDLSLTHGTYDSLDDIVQEINNAIAASDGGDPKVTVERSGNAIVFTGSPEASGNIIIDDNSSTCLIGKTKIVLSNPESDPHYDPDTGLIKKPASISTSAVDTHLPLTVTGANNTITMDYTYPHPTNPDSTVREGLTITIPDGTYNSAADLTSAINSAIQNDPSLNGKIIASYSADKGLTFSSVKGGDEHKLENLGGTAELHKFKSNADVKDGQVDADANKVLYKASITNNKFDTLFSGKGLEIDDRNKRVSLNINGTTVSFDLTEGTYTSRNDIIDQLNAGLAGHGATAYYDTTVNGLVIKTDEGGDDKKITIASDNTAPCFKRAVTVSPPTVYGRIDTRCNILGENTISQIEIHDYDNEMEFSLTENSATGTIKVKVPPGTYDAESLAQAIQDSIDESIKGPLKVYVKNGRIGIMGADISGSRSIGNFKGRLYDRVFQGTNYRMVNRHEEKSGATNGDKMSYIVGRNDMEPETDAEIEADTNVIIYSGLNDSFIFDFTHDGEVHKISITLHDGLYTPQQIASTIQEEGRKAISQLVDSDGEPINGDYFYATIGLSTLGISENSTAFPSGDKLVLCYKIPDDGRIEEAVSKIDGVRGTSAYRVFYEATRTPSPSRITGKADLSSGVTITAANNTLEFDLDGQPIKLTIPDGTYTTDEMVELMNEKLGEITPLVRVLNNNGRLMFYTTENGDFIFDKIRGSGSDDLFYDSDIRTEDTEIGIMVGRRTDNFIWYKKTRVDDHLMRINTTGITSQERAMKALARLDYANGYLSMWRARAGANENRSRHTLEKNQNYREQLAASESQIRDADIATEVAELHKHQIIAQAQQAMQAQSKQHQQSILDVLA